KALLRHHRHDPAAVVEAGRGVVPIMDAEDPHGRRPPRAPLTRFMELDVPPPGAGLNTVTRPIPTIRTSVAGITALNCVAETYLVGRVAPFHRTTEPAIKFAPVTVSVNPEVPAIARFGLSDDVVGTGFVIVKVCALDVPPPGAGLNTVTCAVPAVPRSGAAIVAVSWVAGTNVVARFAPFHRTVEPEMKFVPVTISVRPDAPAVTEAGLKPVVVGIGFAEIATFTVVPPMNPTIVWGVPSVSPRNSNTSVGIACPSAVVALPENVSVSVPPVTCAPVSSERVRATM